MTSHSNSFTLKNEANFIRVSRQLLSLTVTEQQTIPTNSNPNQKSIPPTKRNEKIQMSHPDETITNMTPLQNPSPPPNLYHVLFYPSI